MEEMEFKQEIERKTQKLREELKGYLSSSGYPTDGKTCFRCLNPDHEDKHPSMYYNPHTNKAYCFSCQANYDIFDVIGIDYNLGTFWEQFTKACEIFHEPLPQEEDKKWFDKPKAAKKSEPVKASDPLPSKPKQDSIFEEEEKPKKDYTQYLDKCQTYWSEAATYLGNRYIDTAKAKYFKIGFDPDYHDYVKGQNWRALIIPLSNHAFVVRNTDPNAPQDCRYRKVGEATLFGAALIGKAAKEERPLFVTEGELDALSIISAGGLAVATGSTSNTGLLIKSLQERKAKKEKLPLVVPAMDNDNSGKAAQEKLIGDLQGLGCPCYGDINLYGKCKDANDALQFDKTELVETIKKLQTEEGIKNYLAEQESVSAHLQAFMDEINNSKDEMFVPTGFPLLDKKLDGGLYEGLYILGAAPSVGKTTFILQMADNMCKAGHDVLMFALEMSEREMMARSISRITYEMAKDTKRLEDIEKFSKTTRGIMAGRKWQHYTDEQKAHIQQAVESYVEPSKHLTLKQGDGFLTAKQIEDIVVERIKRTNRLPVVIVDYLQILRPEDPKVDRRLSVDFDILRMKQLSRNYKLPILLVSSYNRSNYRTNSGMEAFKESGGIDYGSDCLLGLQFKGIVDNEENFDIDAAKSADVRELVLGIVKNRNGIAGAKICYEYISKYNYFKETEEQKFERRKQNAQDAKSFDEKMSKWKRNK